MSSASLYKRACTYFLQWAGSPHLFLLFLLFLLFPLLCYAQPARTKIFRTEGNWLERTPLQGTEVYDILQDSRGFMWFATLKGVVKFDGASFTLFEHNPSDVTSIGAGGPLRLLEDKQGRIWVGVPSGISVFNPDLETFTNYDKIPHDGGKHDFMSIWTMVLGPDGVVWIGTNSGLCSFNPADQKFTCYPEFNYYISDLVFENDSLLWIATQRPQLIKFNTRDRTFSEVRFIDEKDNPITDPIGKILLTRQKVWWIHTYPGRMYSGGSMDQREPETYRLQVQKELDGLIFTKIKASRNGDIWFMGREGFFTFDQETRHLYTVRFEGHNLPTDGKYFNVLEDDRSLFWAGFQNGAVKWDPRQTSPFTLHEKFNVRKKVLPPGVSTIHFGELDHQRILISRLDGLYIFDRNNKEITPASVFFPELSGLDTLPNNNYLFKDSRSGIWITFSWGRIFRFDLSTKKIEKIDRINAQVSAIVESKDQTFWIGTPGGLIHYDLQKGILKKYWHDPKDANSLSDDNILSLVLEHEALLWIGTRGGGLNCLNINTEQFKRFQFDPSDTKSLSHNVVADLHIDKKGALWVATIGGGLCKLDKKRQGFERFLKTQGLNSLNISAIEEDSLNQIWVGTDEGIMKLDRNSGLFQEYDIHQSAPFYVNWQASIIDPEGYLYFGSGRSFIRFKPEDIQRDTVAPELVFTELYLKNELVRPRQPGSLLKKSISYINSITLPNDQNFIGIKFAALNFILPEKNQYAYRMVGLSDEWQFLGNKHEMTFAGLKPGNYTLQVKGSNHEGTWNEKCTSLNITILPPWYRTRWAYALWGALVLGSIFWLYRFQLNRKLAKAEALRLQELDQAKTRLYTNITHEFRTPLTVILGMEEQLRKKNGDWLEEGLRLIRRNGEQLLRLVNQLLDLSRVEAGHLPLRMVQGDIVAYLRYLAESFHSYAESKDIRLHVLSTVEVLSMDHDPEKMQHIISNLLSNAIKFTPAGGDIYLQIGIEKGEIPGSEGVCVIRIKDTGIGIPIEQLPHIFDRFYQVDDSYTRSREGAGVGLALVRELVRLMQGSIDVKSEPGKGTEFHIRLPITHTAAPETEMARRDTPAAVLSTLVLPEENADKQVLSEPGDRNTVLLVEDNPDVISYLATVLDQHYQVETAQDGQEGIEKALELIPDIIVSDVMMPRKDGFELCETLKADERTSHIPIILLTAKTDQPSKIEGLAYGADAYLAKPFNQEELLVRLEKLIELRHRLQA
ncbi:MAG: response regulator, partial [Bacteroidetes bacterium]